MKRGLFLRSWLKVQRQARCLIKLGHQFYNMSTMQVKGPQGVQIWEYFFTWSGNKMAGFPIPHINADWTGNSLCNSNRKSPYCLFRALIAIFRLELSITLRDNFGAECMGTYLCNHYNFHLLENPARGNLYMKSLCTAGISKVSMCPTYVPIIHYMYNKGMLGMLGREKD